MAIDDLVIWEGRPTAGADDNGGGFREGASGTDFSQQDAAENTYTDLVIDATTNTDMTSAAFPFAAADVGNIVNITSGTGWTVQRVEILSVASSVATCDKSLGTLGSTGGNGKKGGALSTIQKVLDQCTVDGMRAYIKASGTESISTVLTFPAGSAFSSINRLIGYTTTRGDEGRVTIQASAAITMMTMGVSGWHVENFLFDGNADTATEGVDSTTNYNAMINCEVKDINGLGIDGFANGCISRCEVSGCTEGIQPTSACTITYTWSHDNSSHGFNGANNCTFSKCLSTNNGGDGFRVSYSCLLENCVSHGNTTDGIDVTSSYPTMFYVSNCILDGNGGYGIRCLITNGDGQSFLLSHNAFRSNTSGNYVSGEIYGVNDIILTADPFTDAAADDYTLNDTAGGGAACRTAGFPGSLFGQTGYPDVGVYQHQDAAAGGPYGARTAFLPMGVG